MDNILAICTFIPSCSCCYKLPLTLSVVPRILCALCFAASFCTMDNSLTRGPFLFSCSRALQNTLKCYLISQKSFASFYFWFTLPACIMVNCICLAIFIKILYDCHSVPMDSTYVRLLAIINWSIGISFQAQTSFPIWAGSCPIKIRSVCL